MSYKGTSQIIAAVVVFPLAVAAQTIVTGHRNAALDVPAVQAAVDGGGTVLLRGDFNFGDAGRVVVGNDVEICGETDASGALLTTIVGGQWTFFTPYPIPFPPVRRGPKVAIHHLRFLASRGTAIHLAYTGGALLHHNVIREMRPRASATAQERAAIVVGPQVLGGLPNKFFPNLVSGEIEVSDNEIDTSSTDPKEATNSVRGTGMFVSMYVGADVRIVRNVVTGNTRTGLAILDGIADENGRGSVVIADNAIASDVRLGFTQGAGPRAPIGIVTGFNNNRPAGADPNVRMIPVLIEGNYIEVGPRSEGDKPTPAMGIVNIWNGAVLSGNTIVVHAVPESTTSRFDTSGGILATTSHQVLLHNRILGNGCNAIRIGGTTDGTERFDDVAIANHVSGFHSFSGSFDKCADYWLEPGSHDNSVVGNAGSSIDDGIDNKVTGLAPVKGGVGHAVSDALQEAASREEALTFGFE